MKYIVFNMGGKEMLFMFPRNVAHDRMAQGCQAMRFGTEQGWKRELAREVPIAAGFVSNGVCHGRSESLKLASRGDADTKLLQQTLGLQDSAGT